MAHVIVKPQVEFIDAIKLAFKKSFTFTGRIRRSEYWWAVLGIGIINFVLCWIPVVGIFSNIYFAIVSTAMAFRRLHDTNRSGWWIGGPMIGMLAAFIVILGATGTALLTGDIDTVTNTSLAVLGVAGILYFASAIMSIVTLVFCCMDSDQSANKYGESPKYVVENEEEATLSF